MPLPARGRQIAVVIAATMVLWLAANALGPMLGLPGRYALLFDLAAIAGFIYALVNILQLWRMRQDQNRG
ncbi:DUF5337 domain-containing protein [Jhaorihella thermophila]